MEKLCFPAAAVGLKGATAENSTWRHFSWSSKIIQVQPTHAEMANLNILPPQALTFGDPKRFQWFLTLVVNFRSFRSGATPSLTHSHVPVPGDCDCCCIWVCLLRLQRASKCHETPQPLGWIFCSSMAQARCHLNCQVPAANVYLACRRPCRGTLCAGG